MHDGVPAPQSIRRSIIEQLKNAVALGKSIQATKGVSAMSGDPSMERMDAILGDSTQRTFDECQLIIFKHLQEHLQLPLKVTGREDFSWEEFYVIGPGSRREYAQL
jgi:hypothetical protein